MTFNELSDFFYKPVVALSPASTVRKESTVGLNLMENASDGNLPEVAIIGFPYDVQGVANRGSAKGPDAIRHELYGLLHGFGLRHTGQNGLDISVAYLNRLCERLASECQD